MIGSIFREMLNVSSLLLEPWTTKGTKGFTISASVRIYKIQELLVHALLLVVEKYFWNSRQCSIVFNEIIVPKNCYLKNNKNSENV